MKILMYDLAREQSWVSEYWRRILPDIRDLGYKPGPLFTRIFDALLQARWEGKLRTREEEIRFLTQSFPRNGG